MIDKIEDTIKPSDGVCADKCSCCAHNNTYGKSMYCYDCIYNKDFKDRFKEVEK